MLSSYLASDRSMSETVMNILLVAADETQARHVQQALELHLQSDSKLQVVYDLSSARKLLEEEEIELIILSDQLADTGEKNYLKFIDVKKNRAAIVLLSAAPPEDLLNETVVGHIPLEDLNKPVLDHYVHSTLQLFSLRKKLRHQRRKLAESQERLVEAQAIAQIGNWTLNAFTMQMEWSEEALRILHMSENDPSSTFLEFIELVYEKDRTLVKEVFRQAIEEDSEFNVDIRLKPPNKDFTNINLRVRSNHARKLEFKKVVGTIQDITARKEIERALIKSEEKYHNLFEESRDAIYITTREGDLIDFNKAAVELFGYTEEEMQGINVKSLYLNPFERVKFKREIEGQGFLRDFELKLKRKDGSPIDCLTTSTLWKSNNGKQIGYQGVIRDITEKKKTEKLLQEKEIVERSARLKEQFLANMSHEIRTPINAISGLTHLLLQMEISSKQMEYINGIKTSSEHLLDLVNDILDFSKLEAGKIAFKEVRFHLAQHLNDIVKTLSYRAQDKGISLDLQLDENIPPELVGDSLRLKQILINLLSNAVKFTYEGHVNLTVNLLEETQDNIVVSFEVTDTGTGIPEEKLETIFSSFTQASEELSQIAEGTGLGLAITKQLVDLQGGTITVKSKVNQGSSFHVVLKYKRELDKGVVQVQRDDSITLKDIGHKRILLVEDKKLNQLVAKEMITGWWKEVKVDVADNGKAAIEKLIQERYDLVLMDVQMPVMDGYEATRYVRNKFQPPLSEIPIIAITAYANANEAQKCIEAGMDDFISKPFVPKQLYDKIAEVLENRVSVSRQEDEMVENNNDPEVEYVPQEELSMNYLEQVSGGNKQLQLKIVELLLVETPVEIEKLAKFSNEGNWAKTRGVAHKMKSSVAYLGLNNTLEMVKKIEEYAGTETNVDSIPKMVEWVGKIITKALEQLKLDTFADT